MESARNHTHSPPEMTDPVRATENSECKAPEIKRGLIEGSKRRLEILVLERYPEPVEPFGHEAVVGCGEESSSSTT